MILGVSGAGPGVGLDDIDGFFPTQLILSFSVFLWIFPTPQATSV